MDGPKMLQNVQNQSKINGAAFLIVYKLQKYELKGVLNQGYYRNQGKSSRKDSARRRTVLAGFFYRF